MPYITKEAAKQIREGRIPETSGELNYVLTKVVLGYLANKPKVGYSEMAEVLSAFEGAKLEFYRRKVAPYEYKKMRENGDVYRDEPATVGPSISLEGCDASEDC